MMDVATLQTNKSQALPIFNGLPGHHVANIEEHVGQHLYSSSSMWIKELLTHGKDLDYNLHEFRKEKDEVHCITYERRINDLRYVNKFFEALNQTLQPGGHFIGFVETTSHRRERHMAKFIWPLNIVYILLDYFVWRVWPKIPKANKIYFHLTNGQNRVLSQVETFGRLYSCGFCIRHSFDHDGHLYFIACKKSDPDYNTNPTYGPIIRLRRVGKGGKDLIVFKFRTMYPYSEYLQEYFYEKNGLQEGGKFKDDPRVNQVGKLLRKYWIDELPMFYHLLKGDCKLVGVRPISWQYFNLYPEEFKQYRKKFKPGLIPPVYVEIPKTLDDVVEIERRYLQAYEKHPVLTDLRYLYGLIYNVTIRMVRSK